MKTYLTHLSRTELMALQPCDGFECPEWCTDHRGTVGSGMDRHARVVTSTSLGPLVIDQATLSEGMPTGYLPEILLPDNQDSFGPEVARELAAGLLVAADLVDSIVAEITT